MIDRKEDHTAVLVVDVQGDFTQLRQGSWQWKARVRTTWIR